MCARAYVVCRDSKCCPADVKQTVQSEIVVQDVEKGAGDEKQLKHSVYFFFSSFF